ncbi:MAG: ketosteroid isomerase [Rhodospirillales bacterium 69-11]|nr:nuclear transport factor 2 family protein [Rhodospirillales bacterium]MBN8926033.1 nuclear transport factor 2 family protein [Rhodospirillales bacterium]OJW22281.1 MAG: ketosteroid isomerase [Rhodospirillales bacterium 69-11]
MTLAPTQPADTPDDAAAQDLAAVRHWFQTLAAHVQAVDFAGARAIFAPDMIAFGTVTDFMVGQPVAEAQQWRSVWHHIDDFRFRDDIRAIVSPDRLQAVGMGVFDSTGYHADGTSYDRPGRTTVVLVRAAPDAPFVAQHTHMSLFRDVPTRSVRNKPEKLPA